MQSETHELPDEQRAAGRTEKSIAFRNDDCTKQRNIYVPNQGMDLTVAVAKQF